MNLLRTRNALIKIGPLTKMLVFENFSTKFFMIITIAINQFNDASQSLTDAIHRTQAAQERVNDLWCYDCNTMDHGAQCVDVLKQNISTFKKKCFGQDFICMVKRFSYTTSNENMTSSSKMWSLERRCTAVCESGCIVIGERTKLYACTSCCDSILCNTGKGGSTSSILNGRIETGIGTGTLLTAIFKFYYTYPKLQHRYIHIV